MEKPQTLKEYLLGFRIYLPLVFSLLFIFFLLTTVVKGRVGAIGETRRAIQKKREKLAVLVEKQAKLSTLNREDLKKNFLLAEQAVPSKRNTAGFLAQVERIAMESGVLVDGVQMEGGEIATESGKKEIKIKRKPQNWFKTTVTLRGAVENIGNFLEKIFWSRRIIRITRVHLSAPLNQTGTPSAMTAVLTVEVFFKPLPQSMGPIEEPLPKITKKEEEVAKKVFSLPFLAEPVSLPGVETVSATSSARISPFGP